jgi:hypothetical protein
VKAGELAGETPGVPYFFLLLLENPDDCLENPFENWTFFLKFIMIVYFLSSFLVLS